MSSDPDLALLSLLLSRPQVPGCTTVAEWLPHWRRAMAAHGANGPFAAAVAAAVQADRMAWAFFSGYQGALQAAFVREVTGAAPRPAALCANESGRRLTDIATTLRAADGAWRLDGAKAWMLAGLDDLDLYVLARTADGPPSGPGSLVIVRVAGGAAGVVPGTQRAQSVVPELPHAAVDFRAARIAAGQILPGDGYADVAKPFRLREDVFVTGCTLSHLLSHAHRAAWPSPWRQRAVAVVVLLGRCAALPPSDTRTAVLAAGALAQAGELLREVDGLWSADDAAAAERWRRDRPLLDGGKDARRQRALKAWAQVDDGGAAA